MALLISSFAVGASIEGLDLSAGIGADTALELRKLLAERSLLVFRDQRLSPNKQLELTSVFGQPDSHPLSEYCVPGFPQVLIVSNIFENGKPIGLYEGNAIEWHVDQAPTLAPSALTLLHCIETSGAGDTLFAAADRALNDLPASTRRLIDELEVVHSMSHFLNQRRTSDNAEVVPDPVEERRSQSRDVIHPLVRTHPVTGRRSLFVGSLTIKEVLGLGEPEGRVLVEELLRHVTQERYVYRHQWRVGDVVCWDNQSLIHTPTPCGRHQPRRLHRTSVSGVPLEGSRYADEEPASESAR